MLSSANNSEEKKKYAKLALAEIDAVMEIFDLEVKENYLNMLFLRAAMLSMVEQPEAITVTEELLLLNEKHPGILDFGDVSRVKHWKAQAYSDCGKWKDAVKSYSL